MKTRIEENKRARCSLDELSVVSMFVKYYAGRLVKREHMRFMHLCVVMEIMNNVNIEVQNIIAITKRL